ncbi:hypothetical protein EDD94_2807 [Streptomyces sp. PanSC9]|nr:hypothetical protein EDD94_2807 [Streptomyces sp. PanSC9]
MNIAQYTWPVFYPGSGQRPVLPELLDEVRKAEEDGGVVALLLCEDSWHILHARQAEPTPDILRRMAARVSCRSCSGSSRNL